MSDLESVKAKVQRILTDKLGTVEIDRDGDFIVRHESVRTFISVRQSKVGSIVITYRCPLVRDVPLTNELYKWVAVEGHKYLLGTCCLMLDSNSQTGWLSFDYAITANDLDESELMEGMAAVTVTGNQLDDELKKRFGGRLFSESKK